MCMYVGGEVGDFVLLMYVRAGFCIDTFFFLPSQAQFKEKSAVEGAIVSVGLYSYPVLQAADVLLYK